VDGKAFLLEGLFPGVFQQGEGRDQRDNPGQAQGRLGEWTLVDVLAHQQIAQVSREQHKGPDALDPEKFTLLRMGCRLAAYALDGGVPTRWIPGGIRIREGGDHTCNEWIYFSNMRLCNESFAQECGDV